MQFVKSDDLKVGMRLARPIYNRNGVLLYERNSKLTGQGIMSIKAFGLIGIFILEPAEPVPPMTKDDIEFERFQMMQVFSIEEEMKRMWQSHKAGKIETIVSNITRSYGNLDHKINFIQGLRSREDYLYKHSLNVAMLCAMLSHTLKVKAEHQYSVIRAAVLHDIGQLKLPRELIGKYELDEEEKKILDEAVGGFPDTGSGLCGGSVGKADLRPVLSLYQGVSGRSQAGGEDSAAGQDHDCGTDL